MTMWVEVSPEMADKMNATVEMLVIIPSVWDVVHIWRVGTSVSINIKSVGLWFAYCVWCALYYNALGQTASAIASLIWCAWYVVKIGVVYRFRPLSRS